MIKLEGITQLRGRMVVLENIENSVLKKVLHSRLRGNRFNFWHTDAPSYTQSRGYDEYDDYKDYTDKVHTDKHSDRHKDQSSSYYDIGGSHPDYVESYRDNHTDQGHSDHTDYYK